jgi:hypothetical protein
MNDKLQELLNVCDNLGVEYTENETDVDIVLGNQEVSIDKESGKTDNFYYPTIEIIIEAIGEW